MKDNSRRYYLTMLHEAIEELNVVEAVLTQEMEEVEYISAVSSLAKAQGVIDCVRRVLVETRDPNNPELPF